MEIERAEPIKRIFKGRVAGSDDYLDIFPPGYCPRDGYKLKKTDGAWVCQNCGLVIQPKKEDERK